MTNDDIYINYIIDQRIMRYSQNLDFKHKLYAEKYFNWIIKYMKSKKISQVPSLVICNTLYKLPEHFKFGNKNFFLYDVYLYDFIYDLNFLFCNSANHEYFVNVFLKAYIENLFFSNEIDKCYWLCSTSYGLESFKRTQCYNNNTDDMIKLIELSDLQEQFILLHEANHYIYELNKESIINSQEYFRLSLILDDYIKANSYSIIGTIDSQKRLKLLLECFCDSESIRYMLNEMLNQKNVNLKDLFIQLFRGIETPYFLQLISHIDINNIYKYDDENLQELIYRIGNIYYTVLQCLLDTDHIAIIKKTYDENISDFLRNVGELREMIGAIEELWNNTVIDDSLSESYKVKQIKDFLLIL